MTGLPHGWALTPINTFARSRSGNSKLIKGKQAQFPDEGLFPAYSASGQDVWVTEPEHDGNAIIISAVGARCGKTFRATGQWSAVANTHIVWPEEQAVDADWLQLLLNDEGFWEKGGSAQPFVKVNATFEREIPLPPLPEQRRIVRKLDTLTARTTTARTHLTVIEKLVERYRAAVLTVFMVQAEELNTDWQRVTLERVRCSSASIRYGVVQPGTIKDVGVPLIRVCDIIGGVVAWDDLRKIAPEIDNAYAKARVENGDVLVSIVGTIGRVALVSGLTEPSNIARAIARVRPNREIVDQNWLYWRLNAADVQKRFNGDVREVARKTLNIGLIKETPFSLPTLEEQREIVRRIETAFEKIDRLAAEAAKALKLVGHLDQRILAKAFAGELVPQDPNDEPAETLLARIRTERAAAPKAKRGRKAKV